ncbi:MAG: hypothetical protein KF824_12745 [Fimbriimonadaceae bacterium]|nr:MAG: hypothetical protein KF824_12745 [Fimbriimonadaceae bacterium]
MRCIRLALSVGVILCFALAGAQTIVEDFESAALDSGTMFRVPRYSGSTSGYLETKFNDGRVVRMPSPISTLTGFGNQVFEAQWEFKWNAGFKWMRLTTFNSTGRPNPYIDVNQKLRIDMYVSAPAKLALGLREVGGVGAIGANGGTSGGIEWVANSGLIGGSLPGGQDLLPGVWQTVEVNLAAIPKGVLAPGQVSNFASGNSMLNSPGGYTLEHLAFTGVDRHYSLQIFIDRIYQVP